MQYTIGTLIVAIIALALLTQDGSSKRKTAPKAPVSRYYKVSPNVFNEADGSIAQVNTWLRQKIEDPEVVVQEWGQVTKAGRGYEAEVLIRNRNAYGVSMATKYKFEFNAFGHVMNAYDVETHARLSRQATQALETELSALSHQIQLVHSQLEHEKSSRAFAQGEGRISSRGIKVDSLYKSLQQLQRQREIVMSELYQDR
jgi:hypothetical protein